MKTNLMGTSLRFFGLIVGGAFVIPLSMHNW